MTVALPVRPFIEPQVGLVVGAGDTLTLLATHPDPHALAVLPVARARLADDQGSLDDGLALARDALSQAVAIGDDGVAALATGQLRRT